MALRLGYTQTDVGVIPEDWDVKSVRELAQITTGPFGTLLKASEYSGIEGVPLISVGEVGDGSFRVTQHTPLVPPSVVRRLPQYLLRTGDIVFGRKGAVERSALVTESEDGWFLGSDGIRVRPMRGCFPSYLACQFQRYEVKTWLLQNATGTTMPSLNQGILGRAQIPYAPLPEQRAIAAALSDVDALLEGLTRLIAKKRDLKQAAMQQLLTGQTRLPGFRGEWKMKRLGEVGSVLRGVSYRGNSDLSGYDTVRTKRLLRSNNVQNAVVVTSEVQYVDAARVSYSQVLSKNDILICMANGSKSLVGKAGLFVVNDGYEYTFGAFMGCFRTDAAFAHPRFVFSLFQTGRYRDYVSNFLAGSSINNLRPSLIASLDFIFPALPEQTAIATVLSDMDAELSALEARRAKTLDIKQAMMQELLTGRIRLV